MHLVLALVISAVATSFSDWLCFGVLFHQRYQAFPEVWRRTGDPTGEQRALIQVSLISMLTPVAFVLGCSWLGVFGVRAFALAGLLWVMIPLPLLIGNHLYIKLHPLILLSHGLGWLSKLMVGALVVCCLL
jgi:hypothetical protein